MSEPHNLDAYRPPARPSAHRAPAIELPSDPAASAAFVVEVIRTGQTPYDVSAAVEGANLRLARLSSADPEVALSDLTGHLLVLQALFDRFSLKAATATIPDAASKFAKTALNAQNAYTRTLIAIEGLKQQRQGHATVAIEDSDSDA